jgi:signal transduction histidine kinase
MNNDNNISSSSTYKNIVRKLTQAFPLFGPAIFEEFISRRNLDYSKIDALDIIKMIKSDLSSSNSTDITSASLLFSEDTAYLEFDINRNIVYGTETSKRILCENCEFKNESNCKSQCWQYLESQNLIVSYPRLGYKVRIHQQRVFRLNNSMFNIIQAPIVGNDSKIRGCILILQDISLSEELYFISLNRNMKLIEEINNRKKTEEVLQERQEQLVQTEKLSALGVLTSQMAHEIQSPITVIAHRLAEVEKCLELGDIKKAREQINKIQKVSMNILKIIKGLRSISRNDNDDPFVICSFKEILEDTVFVVSGQLKMSGTELILDGDFDFNFSGRPTQIGQVLLNLIRNANEAIEKLPKRWIKVHSVKKESQHLIWVIDAGLGINSDILDKLMTKFFTTKDAGKGTGLGLSISKEICINHGGNLNYALNDGHTSFVIELPQSPGIKNSSPDKTKLGNL